MGLYMGYTSDEVIGPSQPHSRGCLALKVGGAGADAPKGGGGREVGEGPGEGT